MAKNLATIEGIEKLNQTLIAYSRRSGESDVRIAVGHAATYAIFVHEDMTAYHKVGQAKFLSRAIIESIDSGVLKKILSASLSRGATLLESARLAGEFIKQKSQKYCPVDTGLLRASAFVAVERAIRTKGIKRTRTANPFRAKKSIL